MPGPYFKGQVSSSPCGCFYPDVTRIRDDRTGRIRVLFCINHGEISVEHSFPERKDIPIPPEEWREKERARLRQKEQ
jgi:hypothetical protein